MFWTTRSFKSVLTSLRWIFCSFNAIFLKTKMGPPHSPRDPWLLVDQSALPFLGLRLSWYNLGDCYSVQSFDTCLSPEHRMILKGNITNNYSTAHLQDKWHLCPFDALTLLSLLSLYLLWSEGIYLWEPQLGHRPLFQGAEWVQIQVARVTGPGGNKTMKTDVQILMSSS